MHHIRGVAALLLLCLPFAAFPQDLQEFEKRVTEFTLANGLHFIVLERHDAPVVSFHTYVNAGSVDDPSGKTGLAHMFEHMAFKGTPVIGTSDFKEEEKALRAVEQAWDRLEAERALGKRANPERLQALEAELKQAIAKANSYVEANAFPRIIEENGGAGLNASTSLDSTNYYYSLPSNRIELWFLLESQRFLHPVYREFYKERDVVREERRMRIGSSPMGKLIEMLLATAFVAHPYGQPGAGWASDIENLRVRDAEWYYKTYYVPSNLTIAIAGDVNPADAKRLAEKYFGALPKAPLPNRYVTEEPQQEGERRVTVVSPIQPLLMVGYKRPNQNHPDDAAFDVLSGILASGRTGILYRELVRDKRLSVAAQTAATFPGGKFPNLFLFYLVPAPGHSVEENEKAAYEIIERLKTDKVDEETLQRVKTKVRAGLIRELDSNPGLALQLTWYQVNYGDWRKLFTGIQEIEKVTADDIQRVARQYLVPETRTVAYTVAPRAAGNGESK